MSTNFPGDLTSGFSEPVPNAARDLIPPEGLSFARGGQIPPPRAGDDEPESWLAGDTPTGTITLAPGVAVPGRVFVAPVHGDGLWVELGALSADGFVTGPAEEDDVMSWGGDIIRTTIVSAPVPADILDQIDRATAALCPCGAEPSEEFDPYCSYDCKPTHRGAHTISDRDGTQMRWRPDLVGQVDDTHLSVYVARQRHGRFWVEVFERDGTELLHVRIDDGHRWVGADVSRAPAEDFDQRYEAKLRALVAELEDNRRTIPGVPAAPTITQVQMAYLMRLAEPARRRQEGHWTQHLAGHRAPRPWGAGAIDVTPQHIHWALAPAVHRANSPLARSGLGAAIRSIADRLRGLGRSQPQREVVNQREETLRRVRERRNAGPQNQARAPQRIDPRRAR